MNITNIETQTTTTTDYSATTTTAETKNSRILAYTYTKPRNICVAYIISKVLPNKGFNTTTNIWDLVKNN